MIARTPLPRVSRPNERGAAAIMVAVSMVALCLVGALVLDFGLARFDKQDNKAAADSAVMAGLQTIDAGTGEVMSFRGVCEAVAVLKSNQPELATMTGTWRRGDGSTTSADPCSPASPEWLIECEAGNTSTWAVFSGTAESGRIQVTIKSGYYLSDPDPVAFAEPAVLSADTGDPDEGGCDQLAVIIQESETPGLGKIATDGDINTAVRSVGRVTFGDVGEAVVALLMLEQHGCDAIKVWGGGKVLVQGNGERPGLIHADSLGDQCTAGKILSSGMANGIVANQAPEGSPPAAGVIGVYGEEENPALEPADAPPNVRAVGAPGEAVIGRPLVTRRPVDVRYIDGVRTVMSTAQTAWSSVPASSPTVTTVTSCTGAAAPAAAQTQTGTVFFDCPQVNYTGDVTLQATKVVIKGSLVVNSTRTFSMPKAQEVFIKGASGTGLTVSGKFRMRNTGIATCQTSAPPTGRGKLVIGDGGVLMNPTNGLFQACQTSVVMMGGQYDGCVPDTLGTPPDDSTLCSDGVLTISGGGTDWTAPDVIQQGANSDDWDDLEDLALWTEAETGTRVGGNGDITLAGVFFLPNTTMTLDGNATYYATDAQFVARRLGVGGTAALTMRPDPYDVVFVRYFDEFLLVR